MSISRKNFNLALIAALGLLISIGLYDLLVLFRRLLTNFEIMFQSDINWTISSVISVVYVPLGLATSVLAMVFAIKSNLKLALLFGFIRLVLRAGAVFAYFMLNVSIEGFNSEMLFWHIKTNIFGYISFSDHLLTIASNISYLAVLIVGLLSIKNMALKKE